MVSADEGAAALEFTLFGPELEFAADATIAVGGGDFIGALPRWQPVRVRAGEKTTEEFRLHRNSGVLVLVTEPPGVKVFVDGEDVGETVASEAGLVSTALNVDLLARGEG